MIKETETGILEELPKQSVLLYQANCQGLASTGLPLKLRNKYPEWFKDYRSYCTWFRDGHERDIMGTFHRYAVNEDLLLCGGFAQYGISKVAQQTDCESWERIFRKIARQTKYVNEKLGNNWTIHVPADLGLAGGATIDVMRDMFEFYFGDSDTELWIHGVGI